MTAPPSACAMVRTPCRAASAASERVLSPLPRRITSGIRPGWLTSARAEACPGSRTSWIMAGSSPAAARAGAMTSSASARAERMAAEPVRSTPALRDLTNCEAMSTTTFGRASKLAPITPTGRRRSSSRRPPGSSETIRLDGSAGTWASARSWAAMASSRAWIQAQPVEQPAAEAVGPRRRHVRLVGREHRAGLAAEGVRDRSQRVVQALLGDVGQAGGRGAGGPGGLFHGVARVGFAGEGNVGSHGLSPISVGTVSVGTG